jgi:hypothetical protein
MCCNKKTQQFIAGFVVMRMRNENGKAKASFGGSASISRQMTSTRSLDRDEH